MLVCTFAGHRQVFAADVAQKARDALERLVEIDRELTFYTGGMGQFDGLCAEAVRQLRGEAHPKVQVPNCDLAIAHGTGGLLGVRHAASTAILERV